mgnify:CR=1 FL=1
MKVLIDASPLIALIDKAQKDTHAKCVEYARTVRGDLITTLPCFSEALHILDRMYGWQGQAALWQYVARGEIAFHFSNSDELQRQYQLMEKYQDRPMDFADASLVSLAERIGTAKVFTLDDDFFFYLINGKDSFEVFPQREPRR